MNYTNDSSENDDHDKNCSSSDNDDDDYEQTSTLNIDKYFSDKHIEISDDEDDDDDDDDDDESDIENQYISKKCLIRSNRLSTILRQTNNKLVEIKLNIHRTNPIRRVYIPTTILVQYQTYITHWLQASTHLIDEISTSTYHRHCWSQLLLTYFIEQQFVNLQFHVCTQQQHRSSIHHQHACIPEEDAYKLTTILQKGSKFNINSNIFDHLRRIIIIKSLQENSMTDHTNLQQLYVKQLTNLKQCLINEQTSIINRTNIYSKVLLFLSSLYSIKSETMQTLFCQHLLHNPMYSYLINS